MSEELDLDVIIIADGNSKKLKFSEPKCVLKINNESLLERQIRLIKEIHPKSKIILILGFKASSIYKYIPKDVKIVRSRDWENINIAKTIDLGLNHCRKEIPCLILYGDLLFNKKALNFDKSQSGIVISNKEVKNKDLGVCVFKDKSIRFAFGLENKMENIFVLAGKEKFAYKNLIKSENKRKFFPYEIFNEIIDLGGTFNAIKPEGMVLEQIKSYEDIEEINNENTL